jgi:Domain of unknown function (DUF5655)
MTSGLWRCSECGREFANRNQSHFCSDVALDAHWIGKEPHVRETFDAFVRAVEELGPARVLPQKTRIAFQVRMSFAALMPKRRWLDGHLVLARRAESPCFRRVETLSPRNHVHHFRLRHPDEIDAELKRFIAEAYAVGEQKHLG